ncbi:MAG: hypothetical protein ABIO70_27565 [Pseudomonadota bacterium]
MPRLLIPTLLVLLLVLSGPARADDPYTWLTPPPEQQLAEDSTVIPVGQGAVFVPTITGAEYEPSASLISDSEVVGIPLGQRVLVAPGQYVVVVTAGTPSQGVSQALDVVEGETTLVPVTWGALRIEVTDDHRIPHRGSYEIIDADTREPVSTGFGADTLQGEILQTWLLKPGLYRIVRPGRDFRALKDYATVVVPEAGFVRYRLVLDPDNGDFLGAGVLLPDEFATALRENQRWFHSVVVGFEGSLVNSENVVGAVNQTQYSASAFADAQVSFTHGPQQFSTLLQIEEGASQIRPQGSEPLPILKATDRLRGDVLHTYRLKGRTGPYGRVSAESQAFPTDVLATEDTTISVTHTDGSERTLEVGANETFRTATAWHPTLFREGIGMNTSFLEKSRTTNFNLRAGFGMRQSLYGDALVVDDVASTDPVEYREVESFQQAGIEVTAVASLRLPGWVVYATDVELFADFTSFSPKTKWPRTDRLGLPYPPWSVSWRNTLSLRITRNLSLNYYLNVVIEPQVIDKPQVEQSLLLRTSWALF